MIHYGELLAMWLCDTSQRLQEQKVTCTCKLFIMAGEEYYTFKAYEDMLKAIVKKDKFTAEDLAAAPTFNELPRGYHSCRGYLGHSTVGFQELALIYSTVYTHFGSI